MSQTAELPTTSPEFNRLTHINRDSYLALFPGATPGDPGPIMSWAYLANDFMYRNYPNSQRAYKDIKRLNDGSPAPNFLTGPKVEEARSLEAVTKVNNLEIASLGHYLDHFKAEAEKTGIPLRDVLGRGCRSEYIRHWEEALAKLDPEGDTN